MSLNADNVIVALTGAAMVAPKGSTTPTDADSAWDAAFVDLGYIHEDGITEATEDDTNEIKAFQNGDTVREMIVGSKTTYQFTLLETTKAGLELYYKGSTVSGSQPGASSISITGPKGDKRCFGFDVLDGDRVVRMVIPSGEVTERGEVTYVNGEPVAYEITVTAYPSVGGVHTIKYFNALEGPSPTAPATAPANLTATAQSATVIDLAWDAVAGATGYDYEVDSGTPVSVTGTSASATGLTTATSYAFKVRATNAAGAGPWSGVVNETTL